MERVARTVTLEAPVDTVWRALVEPDRLSAWLGGRVALDPRVGGRVTVVDDDGERWGTIEAVDTGRRLAFRLWALPSPGSPLVGSRIEFVVEDLAPGTRLTVTEDRLLSSAASGSSAHRPPVASSALAGGSVRG